MEWEVRCFAMEGLVFAHVDDVLGTESADFQARSLRLQSVLDDKLREAPRLLFAVVHTFPFLPSARIIHRPTYDIHLHPLQWDATFDAISSLRDQLEWLGWARPEVVSIASI